MAYYLKTGEASRIMQWKKWNYAPVVIDTTTLKDAIDIMAANIGVTYLTSTPIKYYGFEFPEANKLTLIAETGPSDRFSVTIPGTLYEASYSVYAEDYPPLDLFVDEVNVFHSPLNGVNYYGYYDILTQLQVNKPHFIRFGTGRDVGRGGAATVLIYKNP